MDNKDIFVPRECEYVRWPFDVEPREVQKTAIGKLYGLPGAAYFMRQRLGKTWTAYAEYVMLRDKGKCDWFILICPNSLKHQWSEAIQQVDMFTPVRVYSAGQKAKTDLYFEKNKQGGS